LAAILLPSLAPWTIRSSDEIKIMRGLNSHPQRSGMNEYENPSLPNEQDLNFLPLQFPLR